MKLEVGMYVRTKYGIAKIINFRERKDSDNYYCLDKDIVEEDDYLSCCIYDYKYYLRQVLKASDEPIELIEVGDYVNGILISQIWEDADNIRISDKENYYQFTKDTVKSIVTKEQFEQMQYKVGEQ